MPRALLFKKFKLTKIEDNEESTPNFHQIEENESSLEDENVRSKETNNSHLLKGKRNLKKKINRQKPGNCNTEQRKDESQRTAKKTKRKHINYKVKKGNDEEKTEDEENECDQQQQQQQHFIKWVKKDGETKKVFECGICRKEFTQKYTLTRHLPTHTNERKFKCDKCDKAFRQASTLCRHKSIHSDKRPFSCGDCGKTFARSSTLYAHRRTHQDLKRHKCHICGKGFHQKGNLKNHINTHTGERPYKCECGRGFNQISNLKIHKCQGHLSKSRHFCAICEREFPRKVSLRIHEAYKHGIFYDTVGEPRIRKIQKQINLSCSKIEREIWSGCKTIGLPNGDKTIAFCSDPKRRNKLIKNTHEKCLGLPIELASNIPFLDEGTGILIDTIKSPATSVALENGHLPFALLRPVKGNPILAKLLETDGEKQVLLPATAEDLRGMNCKFVEIPLVANINIKESSDGQLIIEIIEIGDINKDIPDKLSNQQEITTTTTTALPSVSTQVEKNTTTITMQESSVTSHVLATDNEKDANRMLMQTVIDDLKQQP